MKKCAKILFLYILCVLFFISACHIDPNTKHAGYLKESWDIVLPAPRKFTKVFYYEGFEGQDFEIWEYEKSITLPDDFILITTDNIQSIRARFKRFKETLDDKEQLKISEYFDENIISGKNYFCYKRLKNKPGCYALLFYDGNNHKLYYFNFVM